MGVGDRVSGRDKRRVRLIRVPVRDKRRVRLIRVPVRDKRRVRLIRVPVREMIQDAVILRAARIRKDCKTMFISGREDLWCGFSRSN